MPCYNKSMNIFTLSLPAPTSCPKRKLRVDGQERQKHPDNLSLLQPLLPNAYAKSTLILTAFQISSCQGIT